MEESIDVMKELTRTNAGIDHDNTDDGKTIANKVAVNNVTTSHIK